MADKYLKLNTTSGNAAEQEATISSAGAGDSGKIVALGSDGRLNSNMMPVGIAPETVSFVASESLTAGDFVNLHLDTGVLKGRKADNSNGRRAHCYVIASVSSAATGTGYTDGTNANLSGLTIAAQYFLGTSGGVTATVPAAGATVIVQPLGIAKSATELITDFGAPIERAA